ncbi:YhcN/YlaJ family sporulation lipoprotein [Bacillus sp. AK128]
MKNIIYITGILLFMTITGCANNNNEAGNQSKDQQSAIQVKNQVNVQDEDRSGGEIAENLVKLASSVPNVNDATALVLGNVAIVGIDVNSKIDRSRVGTIKYSVAESLKHDPHGANAIVIADPDTNVRLREMGNEIQQGRPISGIMDELSAIIGRLMPELPADIFEHKNTAPTESNQNQLPEQQEQELDKEQQDQSKNHIQDRDNPNVPQHD